MMNSNNGFEASRLNSQPQVHPHTERRLTMLEQGLHHLQNFLKFRHGAMDEKITRLESEIQLLKEDQKDIYRHAWRIVMTIGGGAALLIFNVIWERAAG